MGRAGECHEVEYDGREKGMFLCSVTAVASKNLALISRRLRRTDVCPRYIIWQVHSQNTHFFPFRRLGRIQEDIWASTDAFMKPGYEILKQITFYFCSQGDEKHCEMDVFVSTLHKYK